MEKRDLKLREIMGLKFKKLRIQSGLTQEEVSRAISLTRVSVINVERGVQAITTTNILKLANLFNVELSDLFPSEEEYSVSVRDYKISDEEKKRLKIIELENKIKALKSQ